jgi:hypothetical protein
MPQVELNKEQADFLVTYLAAEIPEGPALGDLREAVDAANLNPADIWIEAMAAVDAGLAALRTRLEGDRDPNLVRIGKLGLIGVTGGHHRALLSALMTYGSASGDGRAKATEALLGAVGKAENYLTTDDVVTLLEDFPGGPKAVIRAPLIRALGQIRTVVTN